jgi:hypothetical protein
MRTLEKNTLLRKVEAATKRGDLPPLLDPVNDDNECRLDIAVGKFVERGDKIKLAFTDPEPGFYIFLVVMGLLITAGCIIIF